MEFLLEASIQLNEGQTRIRNAAKYLLKRWNTTPIRSADINDKRAADLLVWLISECAEQEPGKGSYAYVANVPETPEQLESLEAICGTGSSRCLIDL